MPSWPSRAARPNSEKPTMLAKSDIVVVVVGWNVECVGSISCAGTEVTERVCLINRNK